MEDKREWKDYSSAEKLIAIDAYLSGMTKLDDSDETANGERLQWIREHLPAYDLSGGKNYIFISYSHRDYKQVFSDLAYFSYNSQTRVRFWYDEGLPVGEDWEKAAGGFMADPHCVGVVFYLSKNLLLSPSVFKEIQTVKSLKKPYCTVALDAGQYSAAKIFDNTLGRELRAIAARQDELEEFFPDTHTSLIYGRDNAASRITKISDIFDVTEEVFADFVCQDTNNGLRLTEYRGNKAEVFVPSYIDGKPVVEMMTNSFERAVIIHIPQTVRRIGVANNFLFDNAQNLEGIKVDPKNETYFDINGVLCEKATKKILRAPLSWHWQNQFTRCDDYENNYNLTCAVIERNGFDHDGLATSDAVNGGRLSDGVVATIINTVCEIDFDSDGYADILADERRLRRLCKEMRKLSAFDCIREIESDAFKKCRNIDCMLLPESISEIGRAAFTGSNLQLLYLPSQVKRIEGFTFSQCTALNTVMCDADVFTGSDSVYGYADLRGLNYIGSAAFANTAVKKLRFSEFAKDTEICSCAFESCVQLRDVRLISVKKIENKAFANCLLLKRVTLLGDVREICNYAFSNCISLREISFPRSIQNIDMSAFRGCESLEYILFAGTQSEWGNKKFYYKGTMGVGSKFDVRYFAEKNVNEHRKFTLEFTDGKLIEFI